MTIEVKTGERYSSVYGLQRIPMVVVEVDGFRLTMDVKSDAEAIRIAALIARRLHPEPTCG